MLYKETGKVCSPCETVKRIKTILKNLDIKVLENWISTTKDIYIIRITIENTSIGTNGKGISKDLALASAYGELLERLANLLPFRLSDIYDQYIGNNSFEYTINELYTNSIIDTEEQKKWFQKSLTIGEQAKFINNSNILKNRYNKIVNIPFKSIKYEDKIHVPLKLLNSMYGSNGMAAGNTLEEAMVQSLSEIVERYATFQILDNGYVLPDITDYVREKFATIDHMLEKLENESLHIRVKDASLGLNLPVVAVVLFNRETLSYIVNFGAHPILKIAIERSITELFQGRDINNYEDMVSFLADYKRASEEGNRFKIFNDGGGYYHIKILENSKISNPSSYMWNIEFKDNTEMLNCFLNLIDELKFSAYYIDNSYLGFPVCQIIIPGMSEVTYNSYNELQHNDLCNKIKELYFNLSISKKEKILKIIDLLSDDNIRDSISLEDLIKLPLNTYNDLGNITKRLLLVMLYTAVKNYDEAYKSCVKYIQTIKKTKDISNDVIRYYEIIASILNCKRNKMSDNEIKDILSNFLEDSAIEEGLNDLKEENLFLYLPKLNCSKCEECVLEFQCNFQCEKKLYDKLIEYKNYFDCSM